MGLEREFQDHAEPDEQAEEEDDREQVSHSFSPSLSTAKFPKEHLAPRNRLVFAVCSFIKRQ